MSPEKQRIAIAEACPSVFEIGTIGYGYSAIYYRNASEPRNPVDPLSDLNAMHEAEKTLAPGLRQKYWLWLGPLTSERAFSVITATAAQRAEAFLRAIGKWSE